MDASRNDGIGGRLEGIELTDVIRALSGGRKTGILEVRRHPVTNELHFQDGRVVFAASTDPNRRLGEELLRQGKVTVSQLEVALAQLGTGKRIGSLMVEAGILTPQELHAAVLEQIKATAFEMIAWMEGEFTFEEGPLPTDEAITLQVGTDELLLQGIRSVRSWTRIERGAGPARTIYSLIEGWQERAETLGLNLGEKLVLEHLSNGDQTLEQLCREICLSSFEVHRTLWAFELVGLTATTMSYSRSQGPDEGELGETSFPELILNLSRAGETGVLYARRGPRERSFHFGEGKLLFATSNSPDDGLVTYLFRRGMISLSDQNETTRRSLSNKRVGTILREMGVIDDVDLEEMVRQQIAEIVYDTFRWEVGDFVFMRGGLPSAEETTLELNLDQIVAEGIRRIGSWTRVVRGCGGMDNPLCLKPEFLDVLDRMGAGVCEWEVVSALKRPQSPRRVCSLCELGDFRICQILWTLKLLGGLEDSPIEMAEIAPPLEETAAADEAGAVAERSQFDPQSESEEHVAAESEPVAFEHESDLPPIHEPRDSVRQNAEAALDTKIEIETDSDDFEDDEEEEIESDEVMAIDSTESVGSNVEQSIELQSHDSAAGVEGASGVSPEPPTISRNSDVHDDVSWALRELPDRVAAEGLDDPLIDAGPAAATAERIEALDPPVVAQSEPSEPPMDLPAGMDEIIARFNAMHRVVFSAVRSEIGAGATNFVRSCCNQLDAQIADPVEGVQLQSDGSWDAQGLKEVVGRKRIADPWESYQRVLDSEFLSLEPLLGQSRANRLKEKIWQIEQAGTTG